TSFGTPSRSAKAREALVATEKLGDDGKLGAVRAPGERGARRLEQIATLQSECSTDGLNRGFKPLPAPLRKGLEFVPERAAESARLRRVQHGARIGVELRRCLEEGRELGAQIGQGRQVAPN